MIVEQNRNTFGKFERNIARRLSELPRIKKTAKRIYQFVSWIVNKKGYKYKEIYPIQSIKEQESKETFFGYYDKKPVSPNGKYVLFYATNQPTCRNPEKNSPISIVVQEFLAGKTILRLSSSAYNWQQGSRAQWLTDDQIIYNDFDGEHKKYNTRIWSVSSLKEEKVFERPVQDAYKTEYFLSINYRRLMALQPDYGYCNLPPLNKRELTNVSDDGIWKIDFKTGRCILLVSLESIVLVQTIPQMEQACHMVNHVMISP
jgi:hypothetical protein